MPYKSVYPWFFFFRIIRLALVVFLPTLFIILFLYRSSYKSGLVSQVTIQGEEDLKVLRHTISQTGINWQDWCNSLHTLKENRFTLIDQHGTVLCDSMFKEKKGHPLADFTQITEMDFHSELKMSKIFKTEALFTTMKIAPDLYLRKVIPISSLRDNMDRFDRVLFLRIVPFSVISYLIFIYLLYFSTKPLGIILSKVEKFKEDIPFNKNLRLLYQKNEWAAVEEALNKADQKLKKQIADAEEENAKNTTILESIYDSIIAVDKFETILFYNSNFKNDFINVATESQIIPKLWKVFPDEVVLNSFRKVLSTGKAESLKGLHFPLSQRSDHFFDLTITPLRSPDGVTTGVLGVLHDVTEFKLAEQMRVDFIANVSHEIRTPLTSVKGYTQLLQSQSHLIDPSLHNFLDKIIANSERMISLFNDLLNLSVLESRSLKSFELFELTPLIETVVDNITTNYPEKKIVVTQDFKQTDFTGDVRLMEQVLTNLIDNACKYSGNESINIHISSFEKDHKGYIRVTDDGPGIPKEHLQRIFERFYRVESSREISRGTGLGLSIVKHIINKHHGRIWAESEGKGTSFVIELPLKQVL